MSWIVSPSGGHPSVRPHGLQIVPFGDLMVHDLNHACPCAPVELERGNAIVWVHFAADRRPHDAGLVVPRAAWRDAPCTHCPSPASALHLGRVPVCVPCLDRLQRLTYRRLYQSAERSD